MNDSSIIKFVNSMLVQLIQNGPGLPIGDLFPRIYHFVVRLWQRYTARDLYEVLVYQSTLELLDVRGKRARFRKCERVRFLQDSILAYQDQAWGDGQILQDYHCTPGAAVDFHRPGNKTYILIALHAVKNYGDIEQFHITWELRDSFQRSQELWQTEISHPTRRLKIRLIFPKKRPPFWVNLVEDTRQKTTVLKERHQRRLPDGRCQVTWKTDSPRLHERYILRWEW